MLQTLLQPKPWPLLGTALGPGSTHLLPAKLSQLPPNPNPGIITRVRIFHEVRDKGPCKGFPLEKSRSCALTPSWAEHRDAGDTPMHSTRACSSMRALQGAQPCKGRWSGKCLARWEQCALPASSPASNQPLFIPERGCTAAFKRRLMLNSLASRSP